MRKQLFTILMALGVLLSGLNLTIFAENSMKCALSATINGDFVDVTVKKTVDEPVTATLYTAVYTNENRIVGTSAKEVTLSNENTTLLTNLPDGYSEGNTVKVFLWNNKMQPLALAAIPSAEVDDRLAPPVYNPESVESKIAASSSSYQDYYRLSFMDYDDIAAYLNAITSVTVGEQEYSKINYDSSFYSSSSYQYKIGYDGYWYSPTYKYLDITADGIADFEAITKITVTADGYKDLVITVDNSNKHPSAAPDVDSAELVYDSTDYYRLSFSGIDSTTLHSYLSNITSVTVGGQIYSKPYYSLGDSNYRTSYEGYSYSYKYLELAANEISETDKTEIIIQSKGYVDLIYTIDNTGKTPDTPPEFKNAVYTESGSSYYGNYYRVSFNGTDDDITSFLGRISSVTVGSKAYTKSSYSFYSSSTQQYKISSSYLDLTTDCIAESGKTSVIITAKGYNDLEFEIDNGNGPSGNNEELVTPQAENVTYSEGSMFTPANYRITFKNNVTESELKAYLDIAEVTVGDTAYKNVTSFSWTNPTAEWKKATDDAYGTLIGMDLTADGFTQGGETVIKIIAEGYDDVVITVTADGTLKEEEGLDASKIIPSKVVTNTGGYYGALQVAYSETDSDAVTWLSKTNSVTVNGTEYSKGNRYDVEYYKSTFYCSTSSLWLCANNLEAGDYTVSVTADGYKTLEMVITVDNSKNAAIKSVS